MALIARVYMKLDYETCTIHFLDSNTGHDFYIDSSGVGPDVDDDMENETKIDLSQSYILHHLEQNGVDVRSLSRLRRTNSISELLRLVSEVHGMLNADLQQALADTYRIIGGLSSVLEQRRLARTHLYKTMVDRKAIVECNAGHEYDDS